MAAHVTALVHAERLAGRQVASRLASDKDRVLNFVRTVPHITYPAALALISHFRGRRLQQLVQANAADLAAAVPWLTQQQQRNVLHYFSRDFENGV